MQYISNDNVQCSNILCEELGMSRMPRLMHVLNLAVLVAIKTDSAAALVMRVCKVVHSFLEAPESIAAPIQVQPDVRKKE